MNKEAKTLEEMEDTMNKEAKTLEEMEDTMNKEDKTLEEMEDEKIAENLLKIHDMEPTRENILKAYEQAWKKQDIYSMMSISNRIPEKYKNKDNEITEWYELTRDIILMLGKD